MDEKCETSSSYQNLLPSETVLFTHNLAKEQHDPARFQSDNLSPSEQHTNNNQADTTKASTHANLTVDREENIAECPTVSIKKEPPEAGESSHNDGFSVHLDEVKLEKCEDTEYAHDHSSTTVDIKPEPQDGVTWENDREGRDYEAKSITDAGDAAGPCKYEMVEDAGEAVEDFDACRAEIVSRNCAKRRERTPTHLVRLIRDGNVRLFQCNVCDYRNEHKSKVNEHIRIKHDDTAQVFGCSQCDYSTKRKSNLIQHVRTHHADHLVIYECSECDFKTKWKEALERHIKTRHDDQGEVFKCADCPFETKLMSNLLAHVRGKHINAADEHKCPRCDFTTRWRNTLIKHEKRRHDDAVLYRCDRCDFATNFRRSLRQHAKWHGAGEARVRGEPAGDRRGRLNDHVKPPAPQQAAPVKLHKCPHCPYATRHKYYIPTHVRLKHDDGPPEVLKCPHCDHVTKTATVLRRHVVRKHAVDVRPLKCPQCPYTSRVQCDIYTHVKGKHNTELYRCELCDYTNKWKQRFVKHVKTQHGGAQQQQQGVKQE